MKFVQRMANRIVFGQVRYGLPDRRHSYLTRMTLELKAYKKTGNAEHLLNIANYCYLENMCPENNKHHFDNTVDSVTRKRIKS
jgi:hypothetical protein